MATGLARVEYRPTEISTEQLGAIFVKSGFFKDTKDEAQAIVKILAGSELGFGPIASMQGVYLVNNKITYAANLIASAIQRSGKYGYDIVELTNEKCTLHFYNRQQSPVANSRINQRNSGFTSTFTIQDAQAAGINGDTYKKFPRNMLFARALTNGARWFCPEIFNGAPVYTPDELGAVVDDDGHVVEVNGRSVDTDTGEVLEAVEEEEPYTPIREQDVDDEDLVRSAEDPLWKSWLQLRDVALGLNIRVQDMRLGCRREELKAYGTDLKLAIQSRRRSVA